MSAWLMSIFNFISICPVVATIFLLHYGVTLKFHQQKKRELNTVFYVKVLWQTDVYFWSVLLSQLCATVPVDVSHD